MRRALSAVSLCMLLLCAGCGRDLPPEQARGVLHAVQAARKTVTLKGRLTTRVVFRGEELAAEAEMHRGNGIKQLTYRTGRFAGWRIIEQNGRVWRVDPQGKTGPSPISPEPGLGLAPRANLRVRDAGRIRVAGRSARKYVVQPPGPGNTRLILAVDSETAFPLWQERVGQGGQVLSETRYLQVDFNVPPPARVAVPNVARASAAGPARRMTGAELASAFGAALVKPTALPAGFSLQGQFLHEGPRGKVAELRYSDGVRALSVLQVRRAAPPAGMAGRGPQRAGQRANRPLQRLQRRLAAPQRPLVREWRGDRMVTVAGDLPEDELRRVLDSIPYSDGQKPSTGI